ncbi:hypothetical protein Aperf_G00000069315 [Anoplocephala perfoliata]
MQIPPDQCVYTSQYCEENVYKFIEHVKRADPSIEVYVVFISNHSKKVALFFQKSGYSPDGVVVWDYHVIAVLRPQSKSRFQVYDLDTTLEFPCDMSRYWALAIRSNSSFKDSYKRFFRVVDGDMFLRHFASDRSHMRTSSGWIAPPPNYEAIATSDSVHSLPQYMDFPPSSDCLDSFSKDQLTSLPFGVVATENAFCAFFGIIS